MLTQRGLDWMQLAHGPFMAWINGERLKMAHADRMKWARLDMYDELAMVAAYKAYGSECFVISAEVADELAATSLDEVRTGDLRLPYPCFYIAFEEWLNIGVEGWLIEGAYVRQHPGEISITLAFQDPSENRPLWATDKSYTVNLPATEAVKLSEAIDREVMVARRRAEKLRVELEGGIEAAGFARSPGVGVLPSMSQERIAVELEKHDAEIEDALSAIANALCLLTALPESMDHPIRRFPRPRQSRPGTGHRTIPGAVPVRFISFQAPEAKISASTTQTSVRSANAVRSHWRRGHWRRTPFGKKADPAYRPVWIRPTMVNPGNGDVAARTSYEVRK
jgi:hypothetical protein